MIGWFWLFPVGFLGLGIGVILGRQSMQRVITDQLDNQSSNAAGNDKAAAQALRSATMHDRGGPP